VTPSDGGKATVYRTITYANGTQSTESWTHVYKPKPPAGTPPDPDPEPDPEPPGPTPQ